MSAADLLNGTFGFDPADGQHHFLVLIPSGGQPVERGVIVYECPRFSEQVDSELPTGATERVLFPTPVWEAIAEQVRAVFNLRLKEAKRKTGKWRAGPNYLAPHYGKELVLLGWALEDVAPDRIDTVFRNWRGLAPEERWWLYSTANAPFSQNSKKGRGIGWRKALTVALSENPLVDAPGETGRVPVSLAPAPPPLGSVEKPPAKKTAAKKKSPRQKVEDHPSDNGGAGSTTNFQPNLFDL
jgi:hypothetical protein